MRPTFSRRPAHHRPGRPGPEVRFGEALFRFLIALCVAGALWGLFWLLRPH